MTYRTRTILFFAIMAFNYGCGFIAGRSSVDCVIESIGGEWYSVGE